MVGVANKNPLGIFEANIKGMRSLSPVLLLYIDP